MTATRYVTVVLFSVLATDAALAFAGGDASVAGITTPANELPAESPPTPDRGPPPEVDPNDKTARLLVLTPGGPLVVKLTMTIDGQPFRLPRERLIDDLLKEAETDQDGKRTWNEALLNLRFTYGQFGPRPLTRSVAEGFARKFDLNGNGLVDRAELRAYLSPQSGADAFALNPSPLDRIPAHPDLRTLLDADGDGVLSADELKAAPQRLKSRDANGNELLEREEVPGNSATLPFRPEEPTGSKRIAVNPSKVFNLGAGADLRGVYDALLARYGGADGVLRGEDFPRTRNLGRELDLNGNGVVDPGEIDRLHHVKPHIELELNFGQSGKLSTGLKLKALDVRPGLIGDELLLTDAGVTVQLPEVALVFVGSQAPVHSAVPETQARVFLEEFDTDKNGYIERKELGDANADLFDRIDADGDGRLFPGEIKADYFRQKAGAASLIHAAVSEHGPPLFPGLDVNRDGRLGLREMQNAARNLAVFDKNGDGKIDPVEMPGAIVIAFIHGPGAYVGPPIRVRMGEELSTPQPADLPAGPTWFIRMDRNGDGDLSPAEFLGTRRQFDEIDADQDGLIDAAEARAASRQGK